MFDLETINSTNRAIENARTFNDSPEQIGVFWSVIVAYVNHCGLLSDNETALSAAYDSATAENSTTEQAETYWAFHQDIKGRFNELVQSDIHAFYTWWDVQKGTK